MLCNVESEFCRAHIISRRKGLQPDATWGLSAGTDFQLCRLYLASFLWSFCRRRPDMSVVVFNQADSDEHHSSQRREILASHKTSFTWQVQALGRLIHLFIFSYIMRPLHKRSHFKHSTRSESQPRGRFFTALVLSLYHNCNSTTTRLRYDHDEKLTCSFFAPVEWKQARAILGVQYLRVFSSC